MIRAIIRFLKGPATPSPKPAKSPDTKAVDQGWKRYSLQSGVEIWVRGNDRLVPGCEVFTKLRDGSFEPVKQAMEITVTLKIGVSNGKVSYLRT